MPTPKYEANFVDSSINHFTDVEIEEKKASLNYQIFKENLSPRSRSVQKYQTHTLNRIRNKINSIYLKFGLTKGYSKLYKKKVEEFMEKYINFALDIDKGHASIISSEIDIDKLLKVPLTLLGTSLRL